MYITYGMHTTAVVYTKLQWEYTKSYTTVCVYNLLYTSVGGCTTCCTLQWVGVQPAVHFSGWVYNLLYTSVGGVCVQPAVHFSGWVYNLLYTSVCVCTTCCTLQWVGVQPVVHLYFHTAPNPIEPSPTYKSGH
jgi:hypothetical protein